MKDEIRRIISRVCEIDEIYLTDDALLIEEIGIDSLSILQVIVEMEAEFGIDFNIDEVIIYHDITIKNIEAIVNKLLKK